MKDFNIKMVWLYQKHKKTLIFFSIFMSFIIIFWIIWNLYLKLEKLKENIPSYEEKLLIDYKNKIIDSKNKINEAEVKKIEAEKEMLKYKTFEECFKNQIDRVLEWEESLLDYCENNFEKQKISWSQEKEIKTEIIEKNTSSFNLEKLAYSVAMQETWNCKKWTWLKYNNCFWIKNWNTAPCKKISSWWFCIYENTDESFEAFKKIWSTHYWELPTIRMAEFWTWKDRAEIWRNNVLYFYNS